MTSRRPRFPVSLLFFLCLQIPTFILSFSPPSFNVSNSNYTTHFLQDVLKEISLKQKWDLEDVRVSKLDLRKVRFGSAERYEFRVGKPRLAFKSTEEVGSWKKFRNFKSDFGSLVSEVGAVGVLDMFKVEGPVELRVGGGGDFSLLLPMNTSHNGLNRILVGEGITVEVRRAQEVSLFHSFGLGLSVNRSVAINKEKSAFWPFWHSVCIPLPPIQILGSGSLVAYRTRNPDAYIETALISNETIELLPEKCYSSHSYKKGACSIRSLSLRVAVLERLLSFLGDRNHQNLLGFLKSKIKASAIIRFQVELEREIRSNEPLHGTLAEWRTRPNFERIRFEVLARVEAERLKPLMVKKVNPFIRVDSISWSNLLSNVSFTKLRSILGPPGALTLDVKW